jgi:hypothetical protein
VVFRGSYNLSHCFLPYDHVTTVYEYLLWPSHKLVKLAGAGTASYTKQHTSR